MNIERPDFDERREQRGFRSLRARIGYALATERLGASLWELPPGQAAYPYHFHLVEEELLVVLRGAPSLRTPEGWRELSQGDVVSCLAGERGAHQLLNRTDEPVRFLAISTNGQPDIAIYPDSGKLGAAQRRPEGGGLRLIFRADDAVDYWEGEEPPDPPR